MLVAVTGINFFMNISTTWYSENKNMKRPTAEAKALKPDKQGKATTMSTKKGKTNGSSSKVEEEKRSLNDNVGNERSSVATAVVEDNLDIFEEYYPWMGGVVDEQMSWGSIWLPIWGVEYVVESYNEMFSDVAWDDDIWNLKSINKIPNNP